MSKLSEHQQRFIELMLDSKALRFGDFVTKSGRRTPYFVNTGSFSTGEQIARLGEIYSDHIMSLGLGEIDLLFGPAYKGIPLCISACQTLFNKHHVNVGFCFDRKEAKEHGDKGNYVGMKIEANSRVVLVEDVVTAGTTFKKMVPELRSNFEAEVTDCVIAVDRCERGEGNLSALAELEKELAIRIHPIVTIHQVVSYIKQAHPAMITEELELRISDYLNEYGAQDQ